MSNWQDIYKDDDINLPTYKGSSFDSEFLKALGYTLLSVALIAFFVWWSWGGDREGMAWDRVESIPGASNIEMLQHYSCYSMVTEAFTNDAFEFHYMRNGSAHSINYCCSAISCDVRR